MMQHTLTITIPDQAYRSAEQRALKTKKTIEETISEQVVDAFLSDLGHDPDPEQIALSLEVQAYVEMHPNLQEKYLGEWVAIYQRQLVDHDWDEDALMRRCLEHFPEETVLVRQVETVPDRELFFPSFRLLEFN